MLMIGLGGLRRSEIVGLDLGPDQTQEGESKSGGYWRVNIYIGQTKQEVNWER